MKPIKIRIRKKTKVPTKYQAVHKWRSDWILVGIIEYVDSIGVFKSVGNGEIETDAQFANALYNNYGEGIYSLIAWVKGRSGFWSFMNIELKKEGYRRLQKQMTQEMKEKNDIIKKIRNLQEKQKKVVDIEEKTKITEELNELKEDKDMTTEIDNLLKPKRGCLGYLKTVQPIYKFHSYDENYSIKKSAIIEPTINEDIW
ncbi:MAG: hypothetical protein KKB59_19365 [Spirochaetes bacterium]|nr:hypothetical protein [Spirochaetota bacterium]